jgi:hypothetical protein
MFDHQKIRVGFDRGGVPPILERHHIGDAAHDGRLDEAFFSF